MINLDNVKKIIEQKNYKKLYVIVSLLILQSIIETLSIGMIYPLLNFFANNQTSEAQVYIQNFLNLDLNHSQIATIIVSIFLAFFILKFFLQIFIEWTTSTYFNYLKIFISEKILKKHFSFKNLINSSIKSTTEFSNLSVFESERYANKYIGGFVNILSESMTIIFLSFMLFMFSTKYSIIILLFYSSIIFLIFFLIKKYLKKISFKRLLHHEVIMKLSKESFDGFKEILIYSGKNKLIENFKKNSVKLGNIIRNESVISNLPRFAIELLTITIFSLVIFYVFNFSNVSFEEIAPTLGLFALAALRIYPGVTRILANLQSIKASIATERRILNYLNEKDLNSNSSNIEKESLKKKLSFEKKIELKNVSYRIQEIDIFKNINLIINKNDFIGIYGRSGTGKTTLLNLIMGFAEPTEGTILIDDEVLDNKTFNNWINSIGYVGQNSFLLNDTIENNIALSSDTIDEFRIKKSIEQSQLRNFFRGNINLKSFFTEHASNISGGEKQRFSIARAIYKDVDILFFDEPTSALDEKTSENFINVINSFHKQKTIFIISHRIENLKKCDRILYLDNLKVSEKTN